MTWQTVHYNNRSTVYRKKKTATNNEIQIPTTLSDPKQQSSNPHSLARTSSRIPQVYLYTTIMSNPNPANHDISFLIAQREVHRERRSMGTWGLSIAFPTMDLPQMLLLMPMLVWMEVREHTRSCDHRKMVFSQLVMKHPKTTSVRVIIYHIVKVVRLVNEEVALNDRFWSLSVRLFTQPPSSS